MTPSAVMAIVLRKEQRGVSIADEHDSERITVYSRELARICGLEGQVLLPGDRAALSDSRRWGGVLFIGADDFTREFLERSDIKSPVFMWAKGYDLVIDPRWHAALDRLALFFNSSYLTAVEDRYNERTHYVPTGFHADWPEPIRGRLERLKNRLVDMRRFDLLFSGSDRHVRTDRYRQRLLNLLARRGLKVCVAAPRQAWNRPHSMDDGPTVELDPSIELLGNWGSARIFHEARCVLDLPWLDNVFATHPPHHDPDREIFALGWNIFRAGAYGASVLTFDCPANRALGLNEDNCLFYTADARDLETLVDQIANRLRATGAEARDTRQTNLKRLFDDTHTYARRWQQMARVMADCYHGRRAPAGVGGA